MVDQDRMETTCTGPTLPESGSGTGQPVRYAEGPAAWRCIAPPDSGTITRISGNCYWVAVAWLPFQLLA